MGLELDARCAIFALGAAQWPNGFDASLVSPQLKATHSLVSVQWSVDPDMGLPVAPYQIFIEEDIGLDIEHPLNDTPLDSSNGFTLPLPRSAPTEKVIYIRGKIAQATAGARIFALDAVGMAVRETAQLAVPGAPFILFGPGISGLGADRALRLADLHLLVISRPVDQRRAEAALPIDVPIYQQNVDGPGSVDAKTAAMWRLQGNTFARASDPGPSNLELLNNVHLEDIVAAAQDLQTYRPIIELERNFDQALIDPNWNYSERQTGGGSTADATIYPVRMLQLIKALGPVEASTLGFEVTVPSGKNPLLSRQELLDRFNPKGQVPFAIVRIVGYFAKKGFRDTGTVLGNRASPFTHVVEAYARLTFLDQEVDATASAGAVNEPAVRDGPATADIAITLAYAGWLETTYIARYESLPPVLAKDDQGRPKLFTPRPVMKDGSNALDPWFSDSGLAVPEGDNPKIEILIYRRDEFGRWAKPIQTSAVLPPHPIEPPTIVSLNVIYGPNAEISLELVLSRNWKLRTPLDIRVALAISADVTEEPVANLKPSDGVTSPSLGTHKDLKITFDDAELPKVEFSGAGKKPVVVADQANDRTGLPGERSYTLVIPLASAHELFRPADAMMVVAVTGDASNKISGPTRRSTAAPKQIRRVFDPRPPVLASTPWQLVWSSRPNPQRRVRVLLEPPVADSGTLSGFRIWQATETALIDFAVEMSKNAGEKDVVEKLAKRLRRTTNMSLRTQLLRSCIAPILVSETAKTKFFSKFDAISDRMWQTQQRVELELSARHDGLIVLLFTGNSAAGVENVSVSDADLRVVAIPDRIPDEAPILQVVTNLDSIEVPNSCLLIAGARQPIDPGAVRVFWDTGEELATEEEVLYPLNSSSYFPLSDKEARDYLEDVNDLIKRIQVPYHAIFLLLLPESWSLHHLTADLLCTSSVSPADEIPSRRAAMVSCFVRPGLGPTLTINKRVQSGNVVEWTVDYAGISLITPPGYPAADVYLVACDGSVMQGPTSLVEVRADGMLLQFSGGSLKLVEAGGAQFNITATPWSDGLATRLVVRDPTARVAEVTLN